MARSEQPVFSSTNSTFVHVVPPSVVRKTPRSGCGPYAWPSAQTTTVLGSCGWMTVRGTRPVFSRPMSAHVLPASIDLYTPWPTEMCERIFPSPVPAQTTLGSDFATASEPIDWTGWPSKSDVQFVPPSTVFQMPPDAAPT